MFQHLGCLSLLFSVLLTGLTPAPICLYHPTAINPHTRTTSKANDMRTTPYSRTATLPQPPQGWRLARATGAGPCPRDFQGDVRLNPRGDVVAGAEGVRPGKHEGGRRGGGIQTAYVTTYYIDTPTPHADNVLGQQPMGNAPAGSLSSSRPSHCRQVDSRTLTRRAESGIDTQYQLKCYN